MPDYRFDILDVFTDRPFAGNQLAVFRAAEGIPEELLQPLARELNFSETVFAYPGPDRDSVRIRIFTPTAELPFAGHPVLGSAVALSAPDQTDIELVTKRAPVPVRLERRDGRSFGEMTQPIPAVTPFGDVGIGSSPRFTCLAIRSCPSSCTTTVRTSSTRTEVARSRGHAPT